MREFFGLSHIIVTEVKKYPRHLWIWLNWFSLKDPWPLSLLQKRFQTFQWGRKGDEEIQKYTPGSVIPLPHLDWYNRKGCKCRRHLHSAPGNHWDPIKHFFCMGRGGYNAAKGLISPEITQKYYCGECEGVLFFGRARWDI